MQYIVVCFDLVILVCICYEQFQNMFIAVSMSVKYVGKSYIKTEVLFLSFKIKNKKEYEKLI